MLHRRPTSIAITLVACVITLAACGGGSGEDNTPVAGTSVTSVATGAAAGTTTSLAAPTPAGGIRAVNLALLPEVVALIEDSGGQFSQNDVLYTDLTRDGADEAIVPISSGGSAGNIAFLVLTPDDDGVRVLLKESPSGESGLTVEVQDGKVIMAQPAPGPEDPLCCPSFLRHTTFAWNGYAMAIESVTTDPNPGGGAKGTTVASASPAASTPPPPGASP